MSAWHAHVPTSSVCPPVHLSECVDRPRGIQGFEKETEKRKTRNQETEKTRNACQHTKKYTYNNR